MKIEVVERAATERVGIVSRVANCRGNLLEVDVEPVWVRNAGVSAARQWSTHLMPRVRLRENPFEARVTPDDPMLMLLSLRLGGRTY